MRNHLISIAIGFVLGGLVLVPLAVRWQSSPSTEASPGAAEPNAGAQRAPTEFTDSVDTRRSPTGSPRARDRHVASSPNVSGTNRFAPPLRLPGRRPADTRSMSLRTGWRGDSARPRSNGLSGALLMKKADGVMHARGSDDLDFSMTQPVHHADLRTGFELRDDLRVRQGMVASTLLAALPRQEPTVITEFPTRVRLDDEPAVMLPPSIVPTSAQRTVELTTPQSAIETITATPVRSTQRSPLTVASGGSAAPQSVPATTIPYGPVIPYGPTIPSMTGASSTPALPQPAPNPSPVVPSAPTDPAPSAPFVPTEPVPTTPIPLPSTPVVPAPSPPAPTTPTLPVPVPTLPLPNAPFPPSPLSPPLPQVPNVRPVDDVEALPEGAEVVFAGSIPAGQNGATINVVPEPATALFVLVGATALVMRRGSPRDDW